MFLAIQGLSPLVKAITAARRRDTLLRRLPIMAVNWFADVERISGGLVQLKFDPDVAIDTLQSVPDPGNAPEPVRSIVMANARWNIIWGEYYLDLMGSMPSPHTLFKRGFRNAIRYNTSFLDSYGEPGPDTSGFEPIALSGNDGFDLVVADFIANAYTEREWNGLVDLGAFRHFRSKFIDATSDPGFKDDSTRRLARGIALAEIRWSNEFFPFRDVSDMLFFEALWTLKTRSPLLSSFYGGANLVGDHLPVVSSLDIIKAAARSPDAPIEEALGVAMG